MKEKIKVGILLDNLIVPEWFYKSIYWITNSEYCTLELIILNKNPIKVKPIQRLFKNWRKIIYFIHYYIDNIVFKGNKTTFKNISIRDLVKKIKILEITPVKKVLEKNLHLTHTFNHNEDFMLIDAFIFRSKFRK